MRDTFLPFSKPSLDESDIAAVADVLRSGWITTGPNAAALEKEFAGYVGVPHAVALTSATAGMHLALAALRIGPGDEVITPSMTWVSTVNLIVLSGATPVFVDIDRDTLMITPERILEKINDRTKLIIPVHFAGASADLDPIYKIAKDHGIAVLEDAAHAIGTEYKGRKVGSTGTSIFSFHPIKNMTTAEGGMVTCEDDEFAERVKCLKFHGLGVDAHDRKMQGRSPQAEVVEPGYKYNLPDMLAVIGRRQLAKIEEFNARRTELAGRYLELLSDVPEILPLKMPDYDSKHSWHLFIVRVDAERTGIHRNDFMEALKARNIGSGLHFKAVHGQKYYRELPGAEKVKLPNTEWNSDRITSLPLFPGMTFEDVNNVVDEIKNIIAEKR